MNKLKIILVTLFATLLLANCKTTEYITKVETKVDTVKIERLTVDTLFIERKTVLTKEVKSNVFLPCPDDDAKPSSEGRNQSGDNYTDWRWDEEKGGYNVELYCAQQINRLDSINQILTIENRDYKSSMSISEFEKLTIEENLSLWAKIMKGIWKVLFFVILVLWLFGITPRFILKKVLR